MNKQGKGGISWCEFSWNPVTGCLHGCSYCYASRQAARFSGYDPCYNASFDFEAGCHTIKKAMKKRDADGKVRTAPYPFGFEPTFHRYKLDEPQKVKKPAKIFVVSMGDLFGEWVPDEWIQEVFAACERAPWHTYLFLTKNPKRYYQSVPQNNPDKLKNIWLGTTITGQKDISNAWNLLINTNKHANRYISIEPLLGEVDLGNLLLKDYRNIRDEANHLDWVIVGAETGNRKGRVIPKDEWVQDIIDQCRAASVPVFVKEPLYEQFPIKEWPEQMKAKKTIGEWEEIKGIKILDPDGFDRTDEKLFERLFTEEEFERGLFTSTIEGRDIRNK